MDGYTILCAAVAVAGALFGFATFMRNSNQDASDDATDISSVKTKLDFIGNDIKDTKAEIRAMRSEAQDAKVSAAQAMLKAEEAHRRAEDAHQRIDSMLKK